MPVNVQPIFPVTPVIGIATLTTPTALTSRANITGTTGLTQLTPTSSFGKRVDRIHVHGKGNTSSGSLFIWIYNATTSFLFDEILIATITASNSIAAFDSYNNYTTLILPASYQLYVSVTVQQDLNIYAYGGDY